MKTNNVSEVHRNVKVAKNRGKEWAKKLAQGKYDAQFNPTKIRVERLKKGFNQAIIAKKLGISLATYGSIERGKRQVSPQKAAKIANVLNIKDMGLLFWAVTKDKLLATSITG